MNFDWLGDLPRTIEDAQNRRAQRTIADLAASGAPLDEVSRKMLAVNPALGVSLARLADDRAQRAEMGARDQRDFDFRRQEAERNQRNSERDYNFRMSQAVERPTIQKQKDAAGNESFVQIYPDGRVRELQVGGGQTPANPFATGGKLTDVQAKDGLFAGRMLGAEKVLREVENVGTDWVERRRGDISDKTGYNIRGKTYQKFDQAQRDFINATLRRESGAMIRPDEFDNANKQYFPMPGDTAEVIAQKRRNREQAIRGIAAGAGPAWQPPYVFDDKGGMVERPRPQQQAQPQQTRPEIAQARAAIAQGADPAKVKARLMQMRVPFQESDIQ